MTEDEMVGWHHRLNRHEFEQAPGDGEGQGSLVCCFFHDLVCFSIFAYKDKIFRKNTQQNFVHFFVHFFIGPKKLDEMGLF